MLELYRSEDGELSHGMEEEETPKSGKDIGPELLGEEVRAAIKEMKGNKA